MVDVFLSYASQDRERIVQLVKALEADGLSVWWDRDIQVGATYDREIELAIASASCVVAVWSEHSIESEYVRSEVEDAASRNILVPVLIDHIQPPLAHRRRQSALLVGWTGESNGEYQKLLTGIRTITGLTATHTLSTDVVTKPTRRRSYAIVTLMLIASLSTLYFYRDSIFLALVLNVPGLFFGDPIEQELGFAQTSDGTRIAYATSGEGSPILHVLTIQTHLESGQNSPIYDNEGLVAMSSRDHLFVRYDGRGSGLSDRDVEDFSLSARLSDLEAVVNALGLERFGILAVSAGGPAAIAYTARNPERVTRLVLAGTAASWDFLDDSTRATYEQMFDLFEVGWQRPEVSNLQAVLVLGPDADVVDRRFFGEMLRRSMDGSAIAGFSRASLQIDVRDEAKRISVPTLIIQARDDLVIPLEAGRTLASLIPGAKLELVNGGHMASSASTAVTRRLALEFLASDK